MRPILIPALLAVLTFPAAVSAAPLGRLTVLISGLETTDGALRLALFDSEVAYEGRGAPLRVAAIPASGARSVVFDELAPGRYAIRAYHDRNDNGRLDANALGIPQEPYAFSNNARGLTGPAKWKDAGVTVGPGDSAQTLSLR